MKPSMTIFIPSRRRAANIPHMLSMFPAAFVVVDQVEAADYAAVVPKNQLVLHPSLDRLSKIRNWCLGKFQEECVVNIDDDLRCVRALVGRVTRKITEPAAIHRIVWNGYMTARDLGISAFCWCRDVRSSVMVYLPHDPYSLNGPIGGAVGLVGRRFEWYTELLGRTDADLTMQCLLKDRILIHDRRFYFDFGMMWSGAGWNSGKRTAETESRDMKEIAKRWGPYVSFSSTNKAGGSAFSVRVPRKNQEYV